MAGFKRAFTAFPGYNALANIESVNIVESPPPVIPLGAGTGVVCVVGEFEKGPLENPIAVFGGSDIAAKFGGFGWEKGGRSHRYPVAEKSAGSSFAWNGNAFIQMRGLKFAGRMILCRVDSSAGSLALTRLGSVEGSQRAPFALSGAASTAFAVSVDGGASASGTFSYARAELDAAGAAYPTGFTGGETLEVDSDGSSYLVTFTDADQTITQVVDRINSQAAATIAEDNAGQLRLLSRRQGWGASVQVLSGTARATLGLPLAPTQQVMTLQVTAPGTTATWSASFDQVIEGESVTYTATYTSDAAPTATEIRDGLYASFAALGIPRATLSLSGADSFLVTMDENALATAPAVTPGGGGTATFTTTTPAVLTKETGTGNVKNKDKVSLGEFISVMGDVPGVKADQGPTGLPRLSSTTTDGSGSLEILASPGATDTGFTAGDIGRSGTGGLAGTVEAGSLFSDPTTGGRWLSLEDVEIPADSAGPHSVKVRPATDDGTCPTSAAGGVTAVDEVLYTGFSVTNDLPLSRLSDAQMDARYQDALDATIDANGLAHDIQILASARVSEAINSAVTANLPAATASGHSARKGAIAPPIGTSREAAKAATGNGVGNVGRHERATYCFPGFVRRISEIASVGSAGGTGFTDDGLVQTPSHLVYASVRSVLSPEENAGQELGSTNYGPMPVVALEDAYNRDKGGVGLTMDDYIDFKANGICAPRSDRVSGMVFQSDVTSVNPVSSPALVDNKRRYFGDFLMDSLGNIGMAYQKKLNTPVRRRTYNAELHMFLELLKSPNQPDASRLEDYRILDETSAELRGQGFQINRIAVRQYASMDYIVFRLTSGTTVSVEDVS